MPLRACFKHNVFHKSDLLDKSNGEGHRKMWLTQDTQSQRLIYKIRPLKDYY